MEQLVLITGAPGTGKTSLSHEIARHVALPLVNKDTIKEALGDVLGATDVDDSRQLGSATYAVMFALARNWRGAILEANFDRDRSRASILELHAQPVEVFVRCDAEVALARFEERERHPVHFDDEVMPFLRRTLAAGQHALDLGGPVLTVDTTTEPDATAVVEWVKRHLRS